MSLITAKAALETIKKYRVVPVFFHPDWTVCEKIIRMCYQQGFRLFEFTNRGDNALAYFERLKKIVTNEMPDMLLGAGTIFNTETAEAFAGKGADFIVSPVMNPAVGNYCRSIDKLWIPGCVTPTEIYQAQLSGAGIVKLFPGELLGPSYVKSIRAVFPHTHFMPTGGVAAEENNIKEWFAAGVAAIGMGSQLFPKKMIENMQWELVEQQLETVLKIVQTIHASQA